MKYIKADIIVSTALAGLIAMAIASTKPAKIALTKIEEKLG